MKKLVVALVALLSVSSLAPVEAETRYHQPLWVARWRASLDVLIVPPAFGQIVNGNGVLNGFSLSELTPFQQSYLRAVENSVKDWDRAIAEYGSAMLRGGLSIRTYVLGRDQVPVEALRNPEIVIAEDLNKTFILGVAIESRTCLVLNSSFFIQSMNYEDMFNINGQEYGHCLGLGHTNEYPGQGNSSVLRHEVMNGGYPDNPGARGTDLHCISNLNVAGLEEVYRFAITGERGSTTGSVPASAYVRPASVPGSCQR